MRVFVGVELDDAAREWAARIGAGLRQTLGPALRASWVPAENLHLTVRFIGNVADDGVPELVAALTQPLSAPAFEVRLRGCGRFPGRGAPRVIWIGVTEGVAQLEQLHDEFDRRVARFGWAPETRRFSAHLTLARVRDAAKGSARAVDAALQAIDTGAAVVRADHATVFESRPSPRGATYHALARVAAGG